MRVFSDLRGDAVLPCDVLLPPRTIIRKGCRVQALIAALSVREGIEEDDHRTRIPLGPSVCNTPEENGE